MRIAIVAAKLDPRRGGAEAWTIALAKWLTARGHNVHLVGLHAAPELPIPASKIHLLHPATNRLQTAQMLSKWLKTNRFDLVHDMGVGYRFDIFQSHCGSLVAMEQAKKKYQSIYRRFSDNFLQPFAKRKQTVERLARLQFAHPIASYVAVSSMVAADLHQLEGVSQEQIQIIPNGVDTLRFSVERCQALRSSVRSKFEIAQDALVLTIVANNHRLKGVPQLISAIRRANPFPAKLHLFVVGGHGQKSCQLKIGEHTVTYTGWIDNTLEVLAATDVYLHPTFYDACCLSVLEALACGIATISSRANGSSERIEHGKSGFLLDDPNNADEILCCIRRLVDASKRNEFGQLARAVSEVWTLEDNFLAIESLYRQHAAINGSVASTSSYSNAERRSA